MRNQSNFIYALRLITTIRYWSLPKVNQLYKQTYVYHDALFDQIIYSAMLPSLLRGKGFIPGTIVLDIFKIYFDISLSKP